jgi:hypothetical protein
MAVIKKEEHLMVDGCLVGIQIIEEWGYELGDDACLLEDDLEAKALPVAEDECRCDTEASNQVDMLVDRIAQGVADASQTQSDDTQYVKILDRSICQDSVGRPVDLSNFNTILEPVLVRPDTSDASSARLVDAGEPSLDQTSPVWLGHRTSAAASRRSEQVPKAMQSGLPPILCKRTSSYPPASRSGLSGPWSLEWIRDHNLGDAGVVFSAKKRSKSGRGLGEEQLKKAIRGIPKTKGGGFLRHSMLSLKKIARLPIDDRREVLQIL